MSYPLPKATFNFSALSIDVRLRSGTHLGTFNESQISDETMNVPGAIWTDADTARACQIWADYQQKHDVAMCIGQAVGIDPASGQVWFGESAKDIVLRLDAEGIRVPLFFLRVGQDYYARKGGRR